MKKGWVYFIQIGSGGPIKIGWTGRTIPIRLRELCSKYPWLEIRFLGKLPGTKKREGRLHEIFRKDMIVPDIVPEGVMPILETELFRPSESLMGYIDRLQAVALS